MRAAARLGALPEYLSTRLNRQVAERRAAGRDVISLGIGDPDLAPSEAERAALAAAVERDDVAHYPTIRGRLDLREAVAAFYARRFGVELDPEREILPLLGAKEGLAHLALAQLDRGDVALVADPGYPVYVGGPTIAGADAVGLRLLPERGFQPDLEAVPETVRTRANLLIVGYPNNPTGAVVEDDFFTRLTAFAHAHEIPVCHDNAYSEITFDGYVAPSFLATPGAREIGIEMFSLSKAFSLPGWRVAFAVGNAELIGNLAQLKAHVDSGMFEALQRAAVGLLDSDPAGRRALAAVYGRRRDLVCAALAAAGLPVTPPKGAMYVWLPVPGDGDSFAFAERMLERADVVVSPGLAYGAGGEGFVRLALTQPDHRLAEAVERIVAVLAAE